MTATYTKTEWVTETLEQTFGHAICLKAVDQGARPPGEVPEFGYIMIPYAIERPTSDAELYAAVSKLTEVVVLGTGSMERPSEYIVWKGTPQEFEETWRGD